MTNSILTWHSLNSIQNYRILLLTQIHQHTICDISPSFHSQDIAIAFDHQILSSVQVYGLKCHVYKQGIKNKPQLDIHTIMITLWLPSL